MAVVCALVAITAGAGAGRAQAAQTTGYTTSASSSPNSCKDPSRKGTLRVAGNKVLNAQGKQFTFYGVTVYGGLEAGNSDAGWRKDGPAAAAQIEAAPFWHANTVRLQIAEENMFDHGKTKDGVNFQFLHALCKEVQHIRREGMEAVIADQTEWPDWSQMNPTARTEAFWRVVGQMFKNQPGVIYDLYNEPRLLRPKPAKTYHGHPPAVKDAWVWKLWRSGGRADGRQYVGMQTLVNQLRNRGINNLIWLEGPFYDNTLGKAGSYPVKGSGLIWELHHPALTGQKDWNTFFGYLTRSYPLVEGEWAQYASPRNECQASAYKMVPRYLTYLRRNNIGLLSWSLQPGALVADPKHLPTTNTTVPRDTHNPKALEKPSRIHKNYACTKARRGEGVGRMLLNYFKRYSQPLS